MNKRTTATLLIFSMCLFFATRLTAQLYNVVTYSQKDGLPEERLNCLMQDGKGFIWIGARFGLYKFNGKKFSAVVLPSTIRNKFVNHILEDSKKRIWVCLNGSGLVLFENNRTTHILIEPKVTKNLPSDINAAIVNSINRMYEISPELFLVLTDQGAFLFDTQKFSSLDYLFEEASHTGYITFNDAAFRNDSLWLQSSERLFLLNINNVDHPKLLRKYEISGSPLSCQQNGALLIGTSHGVHYLSSSDKFQEKRILDSSLTKLNINHIFSEKNYAWIATSNDGIFLYENNRQKLHLSTENGLPSPIIKFIMKDKEMNYWMATDKGLVIFNDTLNMTFLQSHDKSVFITGIAVDSSGTTWCEDGNNVWKIKNNHVEKITIRPESLLQSFPKRFSYTHLFTDNRKRIWMVYNEVLMQVSYSGRVQKYYKLPPWLNNWFEDKQGNLWLVSQQIQVLHQDKLLSVALKNNSWEKIIPASMVIDNHGMVWIADIAEGIYLGKLKMDLDSIRIEIIESFSRRDGLINTRYAKLTYDEMNDAIWAGSFWNGISRFTYTNHELKTLHFNYSNGFTGERLLSFFFDEDGSFFCRSSAGLYHFVPKGKDHYSFDAFTVADGLPANEIYSLARAKDGSFWVGTHDGISHFHPIEVVTSLPPPNVFIEKVTINGEPDTSWNGSNSLSLKYHENAVSFEFYATSYRNNSRLLYTYKLEGFDKDWSSYTPQNTVNYKNLPSGDYRFMVKSKNFSGIESSIAAIAPFSIATPFYKTTWFYALLTASFIIVFFLLYRNRIRQVRHEEKIKTQFVRQLSELEIKALRSQMNPHFIFNSLNAINRYILKNDKNQASAYLTKFARLIRLILDHSRQPRITLGSELNALELYLQLESLRFQNNFQYSMHVDDAISLQSSFIPPMIIQPFVENAIWHGLLPKGIDCSLTISFKLNGQNLICMVEDNGIGRKKSQELKQHQVISRTSVGMSMTEQRLKLVNPSGDPSPSIDIEDLYDSSGKATGTRIHIIIPITYN